MSDEEKLRVDQIISYRNDPRQKMRAAFEKAIEARRMGVQYVTDDGRVIYGYDIFMADAIGWASRRTAPNAIRPREMDRRRVGGG